RTDNEGAFAGKNVIAKNKAGAVTEYLVYDSMNESDIEKLKSEGFTISTMSLQELFIGLTEEEPKEWGA
ncbi:MAG: hypothetical protein IJB96_05990, partial [Lachnospira sp.]|nr:hypothetical protein [Lachnospira sp.]